MAVMNGVKERVHLPIYDSIQVEPEAQLRDVESSGTLKFFVNVQGKTRLETNLQSASLLPHYNTFEARAMRVVISDLPPEFPDEPTVSSEDVGLELSVTDENDNRIDANGSIENAPPKVDVAPFNPTIAVTADIELGLFSLIELLKEAQNSEDGFAVIPVDDDAVTALKKPNGDELTKQPQPDEVGKVVNAGGIVFISAFDLETLIEELGKEAPPREQLFPNNGAGTLISKFIYSTVTTFYVGEKIMIEAPTWMFPAGAGPFSETANVTTHGSPDPTATFRFAEPIHIDKQQNFRVEIEIPDADVLRDMQKIYGPFFLWVVVDGYMTRDVQ